MEQKLEPNNDHKIFRLNKYIVMLLLFATYCFAYAYQSKMLFMTAPSYMSIFGMGVSGEISGGFWVYIIGAIMPYIIFEVLAHIYVVSVRMNFPHMNIYKTVHILRHFFIVRNILYGIFNIGLFYNPLMINLGGTVVKFILTTIAGFFFYLYISRKKLPPFLWGKCLFVMTSPFVVYNAVTIAYNFFNYMLGAGQ